MVKYGDIFLCSSNSILSYSFSYDVNANEHASFYQVIADLRSAIVQPTTHSKEKLPSSSSKLHAPFYLPSPRPALNTAPYSTAAPH